MKLTFRIFVGIYILSFLISSCGEDSIPATEAEKGYEYHPIGVGKYWIYQVDSAIVTNGGNLIIESSSYIKEEIKSSFLNPNGDSSYVLERSYSPTLTGNFEFTDTWKMERTEKRLVRFEENLEFVPLLFPIDVGDVWEGNLFDEKLDFTVAQQKIEIYKGWEYEVISKKDNIIVNGNDYAGVVTVQQANNENLIERRLSTAYYAPQVGLIKKEMSILDTQCFDESMPCYSSVWLERAQSGFELTQVLVEHN